MIGFVAKSEISKLIEQNKQVSNDWPYFGLYPIKDYLKQESAPLKNFEINNVVVIKKEPIYENATLLNISGEMKITIKLYEGRENRCTSTNLVTEEINFEMTKSPEDALSQNEVGTHLFMVTGALFRKEEHKKLIKYINEEYLKPEDYETSAWSPTYKFNHNNDFIIASRKVKINQDNWLDKYTKIEIFIDNDLNLVVCNDDPEKITDLDSSLEDMQYVNFKSSDCRTIKTFSPKIIPRHKLLYNSSQDLEVIPLAVLWNIAGDVQNVKIPFMNQGGNTFTAKGQIINQQKKDGWFSANLPESLVIPAAEDVAIFLHVKSNYNSQVFYKFKEHLARQIKSVDMNDGVDPKLKVITLEQLHLVMVFNAIGGSKIFAYPCILSIRMYLEEANKFFDGVYSSYVPIDRAMNMPNTDFGQGVRKGIIENQLKKFMDKNKAEIEEKLEEPKEEKKLEGNELIKEEKIENVEEEDITEI